MSIWPFRRSRAEEDAERLLATVTNASRRPGFFGEGRVPDTLQGRFELMTLNAVLALIRLRAAPDMSPMAQVFTDKLFRQFDAGLREEGVGDLSVPKRIRAMAGAFYGRLGAYQSALAGESTDLAAALGRNALGNEAHPYAVALGDYVRRTAAAQAQLPPQALFEDSAWDPPS